MVTIATVSHRVAGNKRYRSVANCVHVYKGRWPISHPDAEGEVLCLFAGSQLQLTEVLHISRRPLPKKWSRTEDPSERELAINQKNTLLWFDEKTQQWRTHSRY